MADAPFVFSSRLSTRSWERDVNAGFRRAQAGINRQKIGFNVDPSGLNKLSAPLGKLTTQAGEFNRSLEASNARVLAFGASVGIIAALGRGFSALVRDAVEVQAVLADINTILKQSADGLSQYEAQIFSVARNTGRSFKETATAALELSRQGLSAEESLERLNNALILTRLSGLSAEDSVQSVTAAINSFSKEVLDSSIVVNKFSTVAAKFFVSEKDLAEAVRRVGSSAQDANVSFDELIAVVTAAQQTTARGGAVIGNSFKTIFTRLQRSSTLTELENLGVAVRDLEGNVLPAVEILKSLASQIDGLSQPQQAYISELTAGVFQINQLKAILGDLSGEYSFYKAALESSVGATNEAIKRNEELNKTYAAQFNAIKQTITQISSVLGRDLLGPLTQSLTAFFESAQDTFGIKEGEKVGSEFASGIVKGIGGVIGGPGLLVATAVVLGLFVKLGKFALGALKTVSDLAGVIGKRKEIQAEVNRLVAEEPKLLSQILTGAKSVEEVEKRILALIRQKIVAQEQFNAVTLGVATRATPRVGQGTNLAQAGLGFSGGTFTSRPPAGGISRAPNFADPIKAAFDRERAAGIPANQIYVDSDPRIKGPGNPLGLLIANRRDEPLGGFQGVNRAIALGQDPKRSGMGGSGIPNFALFDRVKDSSLADPSGVLLSPKEIDFVNRQIIEYGAALQEGSKILQKQARENIKLLPLNRESRILVEKSLEQERQSFREITKNDKERIRASRTIAEQEKRIQIARRREAIESITAPSGNLINRENTLLGSVTDFSGVRIIGSGGGRKSTPEEFEATRQQFRGTSRLAGPSLIEGVINQGRNKEITKAFVSRSIQERRGINLRAASERVQGGRNLTSSQLKAISTESFVQALQSPSLAGLSKREIAVNPEARRELRRLAKAYRDEFGKALDSAQISSAADRAFTFSNFSLGSVFGTEKGDEKRFRRELGVKPGQKLSQEQQNTFFNRRMQTQQQRNSNVTNRAFLGSIAASFIAPQFADSSPITSGIIAGAGTGLAAGALAGGGNPFIAAGAGLAGAGIGATKAISGADERGFNKAASDFQNLTAKINENRNGVQQYIEAQAKLNDTLKEGKASTEDIGKLNQNLTSIFRTIEDQGLRRGIIAAAGNLEQLQKVFAEFEKNSIFKEAAESITLLSASAKNNKTGRNAFGFGGDFLTRDLTKIGENLLTANSGDEKTRSGFLSLIREIDELAASGKTEQAAKKLARINPALEGINNSFDIRTITGAALAFNDVSKALKSTQEVNTEYLAQLGKYQREFLKLSSELIEQQRVIQLEGELQTRLTLARVGANLEDSTFGTTERSAIGARSSFRQAELVGRFNEQRSELDSGLRSDLRSFLSEVPQTLSRQFANRIQSGNPRQILDEILQATTGSTSELGKKPQEQIDKLEQLQKTFDGQLTELNKSTRESLELERISAEAEKRRVDRQNRIGLLGGASFDPLDFSAIQAGRGAATTRFRGEQILRGNTAGLDTNAIRNTTQSARILETQGILSRSQLLPGLPTSDRDIDTASKAFEQNLTDNLNQLVASSLRGLLSDESLGQTGLVSGQDLRGGLTSLLSRSARGGQTDFSGAANFVRARLPDFGSGGELKRQLIELFEEAARDQGTLGEAGRDQARSLLQTDQQKEDSFIQRLVSGFKGEDIARNTFDTQVRIEELKKVFEAQTALTVKSEAVSEKQRELNEIQVKKSEAEREVQRVVLGAEFQTNLKEKDFVSSIGGSLLNPIVNPSERFAETTRRVSGKVSLSEDESALVGRAAFDIRKIINNSATVQQASQKILGEDKLQPFVRAISGGGAGDPQKREEALNKFLLEFSTADETVKNANSSLNQFNTQIGAVTTELNKLRARLDIDTKTFQGQFASQPPNIVSNRLSNSGTLSDTQKSDSRRIIGGFSENLRGGTNAISALQSNREQLGKVNERIQGVVQRTIQSGTISRSDEALLDALKQSRNELAAVINAQEESIKKGVTEIANKTAEAMKEAFVDLPDALNATLTQNLTLAGQVILRDGKVTAEEVQGLNEAFLKFIEEYYSKKLKEKADAQTKENGGIPTPPTQRPKA
jgi:TP901 family phage tail tape measure protein